MKIFLLTQFYFDLHKPILSELEKQGHDVFVERDKTLIFDSNYRSLSDITRLRNKAIRYILKIPQRYWRKKIRSNPAYNESYDLFLCINGCSFHPYLLSHLKKRNPQIKTSLYLWDTNKYYDFFRYNSLYDKVQTFDIDDAKEDGVGLLPSYWFPSKPQVSKYKLFMVGSDHDDRMDIVSKVYNQIKDAELPANLKVVISKPKPRWLCKTFGIHKDIYLKKLAAWEEKKKLPFTSEDRISISDIVQLIEASDCILDTDMPIQTGATERVIWTLARGKKVISTNNNLKRMPFYNEDQIKFIDRNNPVIDMEFLKSDKMFEVDDYIQSLRIDKWIHRLIDV